MQGSGTVESLDQQHKASRGRFSIGDGHGFESILRGTMEFERKPISKHLDVKVISGMPLSSRKSASPMPFFTLPYT